MADKTEIIAGRNPVFEALRGARPINKIYVRENSKGIGELLALAKEKGVAVETVAAEKLDRLLPGARHQGVAALAAPVEFKTIEAVFDSALKKGEEPFLLILDGLEDPQNVGALLRTADAAGVHGVLLPKRRSCPLNAAVAKVSAGAVEYVPVAQIGNVAQAIDALKGRGCWVIGADMDGEKLYGADLKGPVALVIGAEGRGLGHLVREKCDRIVSIPMRGAINSLNASVAGAILMYEVARQRSLSGSGK